MGAHGARSNRPQNSSAPVRREAPQQPVQRAQPASANTARAEGGRRGAVGGARKKKSGKRTLGIIALSVLAVLLVSAGGIWIYLDNLFSPGDMGTLDKDKVVQTAPELKQDQYNLLMLGIDYSEDDAVKRDPIGQTDMIMYVRFDVNKVDGVVNGSTMQMLQIPRDVFVGEVGGSAGKINGIFAHTTDTENRVNALAEYISKGLDLPIDGYATINMDGLTELIDRLGGLDVYIPKTMEYNGSKLEQGTRHLMGAECEFFLRSRKDPSATPRSDIDRLENQRYFYSALFTRIRTANLAEVLKWLPVVQYFVDTNIDTTTLAALGVKMLSMSSANITMVRMPVASGNGLYQGKYDVIACAKPETATMLNTYFRLPTQRQLTAADIYFGDYEYTQSNVIDTAVTQMTAMDESTVQGATG